MVARGYEIIRGIRIYRIYMSDYGVIERIVNDIDEDLWCDEEYLNDDDDDDDDDDE